MKLKFDRTVILCCIIAVILFSANSTWAAGTFTIQHPSPLPASYSDVLILDTETVLVSGARTEFTSPLLIRTDDGGNSWQRIAVPTSYSLRELYSLDGNTIWAAGYDATLLRSDDGGGSWTNVNIGLEGQRSELVALHFSDEMNGWAVGRQRSDREFEYWLAMALKTQDGGKTWQHVPLPKLAFESGFGRDSLISRLSSVYFLDADKGWVCGGLAIGNEGVLLRTDNGGLSWQQEPTGNVRELIDFAILSDEIFVAVGDNGALIRSTDAGKEWQQVIPKIEVGASLTTVYAMGQTIFTAGALRRILKSEDGGVSWQLSFEGQSKNAEQVQWFSSVEFADSRNGWAVGSHAGLFKTSDGGDSWHQMTRGVLSTLYSVHFFDDVAGLVAGRDGTILRTTNGGSEWEPVSIEGEDSLKDLTFVSREQGWLIGSDHLFATKDGGDTWERIYDIQQRNAVSDLAFTDAENGWMLWGLHEKDTIRRTVDGGRTWVVQKEFPEQLTGIHFVNDSTGWVLSPHDLYFTKDYGENWDLRKHDTTTWFSAINFQNESTGWITGSASLIPQRPALFFTSDGGGTWENLLVNDPESPLARESLNGIAFNDHNTGWIRGRGNHLYRTTDRGLTWTRQTHFLEWESGALRDLFALPDGQVWFVGDNGFILNYKAQATDVEDQFAVSLKRSGIHIYPNPAAGNLAIDVPLSFRAAAPITIRVFNLMGKLVLQRMQQGDVRQINLDATQLSTGVYFLELQQDSTSTGETFTIVE